MFNRRLLVDHWHDHAVNRVHLFLEPGVDPRNMREEIERRVGTKYALKILLPNEVTAFHAAQVNRAFVLMDAIQLLIAAVTIAGILDLLLSSILERKHELALWRTIGADERAVRRSIVIESGTIGLNGAALGTGLGIVTAWIWIGINLHYLLGYYLEFYFSWGSAAWFVVLVSTMTVIAGYLAASFATRQPILDGLRVD
jgi:putative ABC transport system permease protein